LVVDEVGYLPLERQAANLLFALVSRRYERGSIIITSNRGLEQWGEILGDGWSPPPSSTGSSTTPP
jgi:DNA replication protein DnaC